MFSDSENYVRLLKIYREKSNNDLELFTKIVFETCAQIGALQPEESVIRKVLKILIILFGVKNPSKIWICDTNFVWFWFRCRDIFLFQFLSKFESFKRRFCENASGVRLQSQDPTRTLNETFVDLGFEPDQPISIQLVFDAVFSFEKQNSRFPGDTDNSSELDQDVTDILSDVSRMARNLESEPTVKKELIEEIVRTGAMEIHSVASYLGGITAQEIIKVRKVSH